MAQGLPYYIGRRKPSQRRCTPGVPCAPGSICCEGHCKPPSQCALGELDGSGYDVDELEADAGAWWNTCPDGTEFNVSTFQCEPSSGDVEPEPPGFTGKCPDGYIGVPPACWPMSLPAQPPVPGQPPVVIPTPGYVSEAECAARVAAAEDKASTHTVLVAVGSSVAGAVAGALAAWMLSR